MDIKDILRNNLETLRQLGRFGSNLSLANMAGVSSATINTFTIKNHATHPKINKLDEVAKALKVPVWSLLIENFPFHQYEKFPVREINQSGLELLQILSKMDSSDTDALLDYARYMCKKSK